MRFGKYGWSYLLLRVGLGITFLWIGIDMVRHPDSWIGFLPGSIPASLSRESALIVIAVTDMATGCLLLLNKLPRLTALAAAGHLAGIIVVNGIDGVLIRDVSLLGSALALVLWPHHPYRRHGWQRWFGRKHAEPEE